MRCTRPLDDERIASQSPAVAGRLLRTDLGFRGVIVTDSLEAQAVLDRSGVAEAAERSLRAGADLILLTGSASWNDVFPRLAADRPGFAGVQAPDRAERGAGAGAEAALGLRPPG